MTNEMTYDKEYHFLDSFSVFMDIDSLIYILLSVCLFWGIANVRRRVKKREKIGFGVFTGKYMFACAIPTFLFYAVALVQSGVYVTDHIIILFLPLVYAIIIQAISYVLFIRRK